MAPLVSKTEQNGDAGGGILPACKSCRSFREVSDARRQNRTSYAEDRSVNSDVTFLTELANSVFVAENGFSLHQVPEGTGRPSFIESP